MSIGDPAGKVWTYGTIDEVARLRTGTLKDSQISTALMFILVRLNVQTIAKRLVDAGGVYGAPYTESATLTITGSASPYTVNLSSVTPYLDKPLMVTHITSTGVRSLVEMLPAEEAESRAKAPNSYASSIFGSYQGDSIRLYVGTSFTITTSTDTIDFKYYRQALAGSTNSNAVVSDTSYTISGTTVTGFTGMTLALVGGTLVGLDNSANPFARTITSYISSSSFTIDSTVTAAGASTNGYIIPPNSYTYTVTTGTNVDVPDSYGGLLAMMLASDYSKHKNGGVPDSALEQNVQSQLDKIMGTATFEKQNSPKGE